MKANLNKKIAVIDIDGTLINGQSQKELIGYMRRKKIISTFRYVIIYTWFMFYKLGLIDDVNTIYKFGVSIVKGESVSKIEHILDEFMDQVLKNKIYKESYTLINDLRRQGYDILFLSTSISPIVLRIAKIFSVRDYISTRLCIMDDLYTGEIAGEIIYGNNKKKALQKYASLGGYALDDSVAFADHPSDFSMMKLCGKSYIVNPSRKMIKVSQREGVDIIYIK